MTQCASGVKVRRATAKDAPGVASVLRQAFAEYEPLYTESGYAATTPGAGEIVARLSQGPVWVAARGEQMVGTSSVVRKPEGIYIRSMAVIPSARGLRIGHWLLDEIQRFAITEGCTRLFLSTTPFLNKAIRLYVAFGFRRTNDGPYELFGTPLFTMEKTLSPAPILRKRIARACTRQIARTPEVETPEVGGSGRALRKALMLCAFRKSTRSVQHICSRAL